MSFCFVRAVFAALLVALVASPARAQDGGAPTAATAVPARALTLEAAVARARAEGPDARVARFEFEQARWDVRAFRTRLRPKLVLSGSAPGLERSITDVPQDDGSVRYVEQNFTSSRANLNVEQALPFTGGTLTVGSRLGRVDRFGAQAFGQWQTTPVTLGLRQPLFQFNDVKWARRLEPLSFEIARQTYAEDVAQVAETTAERFFAVVRERGQPRHRALQRGRQRHHLRPRAGPLRDRHHRRERPPGDGARPPQCPKTPPRKPPSTWSRRAAS